MHRFIGVVSFLSLLHLASYVPTALSQEDNFFDYSAAENIILYTPNDEGGRWLSRPFDEGPADIGKRFFQLVLPHLAESSEVTFPLDEPLYSVDITTGDTFKRLSIGEGWISDGNKVAFIEEDDWRAVSEILSARVESIPPERIGKDYVERRYQAVSTASDVDPATLAEIEQREIQSIQNAISRVGAYTKPQPQERIHEEVAAEMRPDSEPSGSIRDEQAPLDSSFSSEAAGVTGKTANATLALNAGEGERQLDRQSGSRESKGSGERAAMTPASVESGSFIYVLPIVVLILFGAVYYLKRRKD